MPTELALLPFIESAFNPQAVSSARAAQAHGGADEGDAVAVFAVLREWKNQFR
jgi:hypothetical protein